jgi:hypothetical protein
MTGFQLAASVKPEAAGAVQSDVARISSGNLPDRQSASGAQPSLQSLLKSGVVTIIRIVGCSHAPCV